MATIDDVISTLQNVARQLGASAQSQINARPVASTTVSPKVTACNNIGTTAGTTIISTSALRHGVLFHNPGTTGIYIYPTAIATAPNATTLGGTILVSIGSTLVFPSAQFPNVNCGWSAFASTGSNQSFTVVEFF